MVCFFNTLFDSIVSRASVSFSAVAVIVVVSTGSASGRSLSIVPRASVSFSAVAIIVAVSTGSVSGRSLSSITFINTFCPFSHDVSNVCN